MRTLSLILNHPDDTFRRATELGSALSSGDVVLLSGDVGAGKTHFARSLIQSILITPQDVPSPTFTLVQTYESTRGEVWHADLYRITSPDEVEELGLVDAFEAAICMIEWPDRMGMFAPPSALSIDLSPGVDEDARQLTAQWQDDKWNDKLLDWKE
ncbi:MAG: tRNA (adenosine(37)-N6)-threonylcarbamoyltransferase complex ATPase subunit type 1 TsaE [Sulfitobacter sp.]